jgi:hypothetical protein
MSNEPNNLSDSEAALVSHIINLQARIDALTAVVELLALNNGSTRDKFRHGLQTVIDASIQKRLEKLEAQSPRAAALVDLRKEMPEIDQKFLDALEFDGEK